MEFNEILDRSSIFAKAENEVASIKICITKKEDFTNKYSYIFEDYDQYSRAKIGRLYKPRKRLTEIANGDVATNERIAESRVFFDYYVNPNKISYLAKESGCVSYEAVRPITLGTKIKFPTIGDQLILYSLNTSYADHESVREFECQVVNVYPYMIKYDIHTGNYSKAFSYTLGTVELDVDLNQSTLHRSIVIPPKIPRLRQIDVNII